MSYNITLNFFPLKALPRVDLYWRDKGSSVQRSEDRIYQHTVRLAGEPNLKTVWASFTPRAGYSVQKEFDLTGHIPLGIRYVSEALFDTVAHTDINIYKRDKDKIYSDEIEVVTKSFPQGSTVMHIRPVFVQEAGGFGLVIHESFRRKEGVPFSRTIQQLSGSLDSSGRSNARFHVESWERLQQFLNSVEFGKKLQPLVHADSTASLIWSAIPRKLAATILHKRVYEFGGNKQNDSQFYGIKNHGPYKLPSAKRHYLTYLGLEKDRPIARLLYKAIHEGRQDVGFEGFHSFFRYEAVIHPDARYIAIQNFDYNTIENIAKALSKLKDAENTLAIIILPRNEESVYYRIKTILLKYGIVSQVCTRELASAATSLKWATANMALGVFAKLGGTPWHVRTVGENSVILGIAQATEWEEDVDGKPVLVRQLAYSVLTDSSGEFKNLHVLADVRNNNSAEFISNLEQGLTSVLSEQANNSQLVTLHTPFSLRREVLDSLQSTVDKIAEQFQGQCSFCVVKLNDADQHSWFGYFDGANSLVPIESTLVYLGRNEYLLWFEGQDERRRLVKRRFGGPAHIRFLGATPSDHVRKKVLDDLVNLAGANWRGFNARSEPVSIYYCRLVAQFLRNCHRHGVSVPPVENLNPWFL